MDKGERGVPRPHTGLEWLVECEELSGGRECVHVVMCMWRHLASPM